MAPPNTEEAVVAAGLDPKAEALEVAPPNAVAVVAAGFDPNAEALDVAPNTEEAPDDGWPPNTELVELG